MDTSTLALVGVMVHEKIDVVDDDVITAAATAAAEPPVTVRVEHRKEGTPPWAKVSCTVNAEPVCTFAEGA